jgi:O-antigen ligase
VEFGAHKAADFKVGVDIDRQDYWKNGAIYQIPLNQYGTPVNVSTYERTAWFRVGLHLLKENSLGYGLVHHSFDALAQMNYPDFHEPIGNTRGATHSGWIDFALGLGIPGLLLVLVPLFAAWYRSLQQEGLWFSYAAWTIPIMTFGYIANEVAESHYIKMPFFMISFFAGSPCNIRRPAFALKSEVLTNRCVDLSQSPHINGK